MTDVFSKLKLTVYDFWGLHMGIIQYIPVAVVWFFSTFLALSL